MDEQPDIHEYLRQAMREHMWNVPRLAEACDVSLGLAAKWVSENPRYRVTPSPASCEKIAAALHEDPDYILSLAGHRHQRPDQVVEGDPLKAVVLSTIAARWDEFEEWRKQSLRHLAATAGGGHTDARRRSDAQSRRQRAYQAQLEGTAAGEGKSPEQDTLGHNYTPGFLFPRLAARPIAST